jgi:hypothetical protein
MKITSLAKTLTAAGIFSISAASAFAQCDNYSGNVTRGFGNSSVVETWGGHYISVDQDGDVNHVRGKIQGTCNVYITGQYGDGNSAKAKIRGAYNGVSMLQNADNVRARAKVVGTDNAIFSAQSRSGSNASFDVAGHGNRIVNIQH